MKHILLSAIIAISAVAAHANDPEIQADKDAITKACTEEAKAAGCADKVVGEGLLKCIHAHKKANPNFVISDGCKNAKMELRHDRREKHGKH